ncbi:Riboflavin synthase alpha chain [Anaerococcus prevotii]|uniref:Riboflavin synthase n=1 Tax=Anaerococcus prevotii (strain ATCC 9321 / DSM 20548 / JCM 6508 / NCTC 11806 / PC1) TaxID=525919 RepID=C7RDC3_ANAPD|nr:riboflavin synthase [Anaerococcus prevotii]ACV29186.1 riboflavin synthase, alpha subunit [Anaerococcus prevotii DSM 20548]SUU94860.1 Riboflavin synthase alpha chain [Anaerococcus prevotii]
MFTGIAEELGLVKEFKQKSDTVEIKISCKKVLEDTKLGDSIMTDGVCLTVTEMTDSYYKADIMNESLKKTKFDRSLLGKEVNLERALRFSDRLDGHIVQGHVDGVGRLISINKNVYRFKTTRDIGKYIVNKGSIAIDGISLTVSYEQDDIFEVSLIPETLSRTNLKNRRVGDLVNLETDILSRIVEKLNRSEKKEDRDSILGLL